jgi:hypothetical protein
MHKIKFKAQKKIFSTFSYSSIKKQKNKGIMSLSDPKKIKSCRFCKMSSAFKILNKIKEKWLNRIPIKVVVLKKFNV